MNLPEGRPVAESTATVADLLKQYGQQFKGCIHVYRLEQGQGSEGFILIDNGTVLAAALSSQGINLHQLDALYRMMALEGVTVEGRRDDGRRDQGGDAGERRNRRSTSPRPRRRNRSMPVAKEKAEYDHILSLMASLPGVVAAAFVADGLPVFQQGKTDFEHISAATEDMVRTGARIAGELQLGTAEQIIIETQNYKVIIAPVSDMFLCVLARGETNLGLIRLNIRSTQNTCKS